MFKLIAWKFQDSNSNCIWTSKKARFLQDYFICVNMHHIDAKRNILYIKSVDLHHFVSTLTTQNEIKTSKLNKL